MLEQTDKFPNLSIDDIQTLPTNSHSHTHLVDPMICGTSTDITEHKKPEQELETTAEFLDLMNRSTGTADLVHSAINYFRDCFGFEAVGIRIKDSNTYPYFETCGFSDEFVRMENSLCVSNITGQLICDSNGYPIQECMCGNVVCGRFDPSKPFFTIRGSFWTNCTTELLATTTEADRQARARNRCNGEGYESVALRTLCIGEEKLDLLQLNDRRKGQFTPEKISMLERLVDNLAMALSNSQAEESLQEAHENLQIQSEALQAHSQELKKAYKSLSESEERLQQIQEMVGIESWEQYIDGGPSVWSPGEYALLGLDPDTCFPSHAAWRSTVFPDDLELADADIRKAIATKGTIDFDYCVMLPDGDYTLARRSRWDFHQRRRSLNACAC